MIETCPSHLPDVRSQVHPNCVVCSRENRHGLHLDFKCCSDRSVRGRLYCNKSLEGYSGWLHGGILSAALDGAMTHCLFAAGIIAVTADLKVRFRHPVLTNRMATVRAWISRSRPPIYELKAEIVQMGQIRSTAAGTFMEQSQPRGNSAP